MNAMQARLCPIRYERHRLRSASPSEQDSQTCTSKNGNAPEKLVVGVGEDDIFLDIYPPLNGPDACLPWAAPTLLIMPGLCCNSQDLPGTTLVRSASSRGFRSIVVGRRGHEAPLVSPRMNIFGFEDEIEMAYHRVVEMLPAKTPLFFVGISSGSKVVVTALGKWDERRKKAKDGERLKSGEHPAPGFVAASSIAPGYDLSKCMGRFRPPYDQMILHSTKEFWLIRNAPVLRAVDPVTYSSALEATSLQELLDRCAPFAGHPDAASYYADQNPIIRLQSIRTPMFVVNAEDDPCTIADNLFEPSPCATPVEDGARPPNYAEIAALSPCAVLAFTPSGSHCPFLDGYLFPFTIIPLRLGLLQLSCWSETATLDFFESSLETFGPEPELLEN